MAALRERFKEMGDLPALPDTAIRLVQALNGDEMGMEEIERIVRLDEAIAAAVLRMANSAAMGGDRTFNLQESITRIGGRKLQRLAMSMSTGRLLRDGGKGYGLLRGDLWRGSLCGALGAELIAQETGLEDPGVCFVAGLLRDVGKLAMDKVFEVSALEEEFRKEHPDMDQMQIEREVFEIDHAALGGELAAMWKLPDRLVTAIARHHAPPDGDERDALVDIVHCADALTCWLAIGVGYDGLAYRLDERAAHDVGLDRTAIEKYLPELRTRFDKALEDMGPVSEA